VRIPAVLLSVLVLALAACGGGDEPASGDVVLDATSFKERVAAELRKADLEAEPAFGRTMEVNVADGPNRVDVLLAEPFAEYESDPDRRDEIIGGIVEETRTRVDEGIDAASFAEVEGDLMPVLKPRFELRTFDEEPAATPFPADLSIVYGVDRERDFTIVTPADLERWGKSVEELHEIALDNLLRQTNKHEKLLCEPSSGSELCGWASGDGYDATRMIVPELRRQIERVYDGDPALYAVPAENIFVALPLALATRANTRPLLERRVEQDFATAKEKPVSPELFVEQNGKLVVLGA
jgi:uncharacterized protein YtpQ (UPF0354 family)